MKVEIKTIIEHCELMCARTDRIEEIKAYREVIEFLKDLAVYGEENKND